MFRFSGIEKLTKSLWTLGNEPILHRTSIGVARKDMSIGTYVVPTKVGKNPTTLHNTSKSKHQSIFPRIQFLTLSMINTILQVFTCNVGLDVGNIFVRSYKSKVKTAL